MKDKGRYWMVPLDAIHPESGSSRAHRDQSSKMRPQIPEFLRSPEATSLLTSYGFSLPRRTINELGGVLLTVRLAALVSALLIGHRNSFAYWLTYSRWRWKFLVEAAVALPIVLPPLCLVFMSW